jgi:hypothetical protein
LIATDDLPDMHALTTAPPERLDASQHYITFTPPRRDDDDAQIVWAKLQLRLGHECYVVTNDNWDSHRRSAWHDYRRVVCAPRRTLRGERPHATGVQLKFSGYNSCHRTAYCCLGCEAGTIGDAPGLWV